MTALRTAGGKIRKQHDWFVEFDDGGPARMVMKGLIAMQKPKSKGERAAQALRIVRRHVYRLDGRRHELLLRLLHIARSARPEQEKGR